MKLGFLRQLLPFERGIPSHDALNDVINGLDAEVFSQCFSAWVESLRDKHLEIVAIDGKTSRRARGAIVPHCTPSRPGHHASASCLASRPRGEVQRNHGDPAAARTPATLRRAGQHKPHETVKADHGRIETRRHSVSHDVAWLASDHRFPGEPRFPGLKAIAMVEAITEDKASGATTTARRYYISSMALDPAFFAKAVRAHWGIENRLHWVLDAVFHDDLMRLRTADGPKNMATVKHMALNLMKSAPGKDSLRVKRKAAGWDDAFLLAIIAGQAQ